MISNKILKSASIRSLSTGQGLGYNDVKDDDEFEYIEGSVPAPNYYHTNLSSIKI